MGTFSVVPFLGRSSWDAAIHLVGSGAAGDANRYEDFVGDDLRIIMPALGWRFSASPADVGVVLVDSETHKPLAAAQCNRIKIGQDFGVNVSYICGVEFEGLGLSKVASAVAITTFAEATQDPIAFVNVQYRNSNHASAGLALRLGLQREPGLDVCVERKGAEPIRLQTCRASLPDVHATCLQILWDAQKTDWAQRLSGTCERQQDQLALETAPCP